MSSQYALEGQYAILTPDHTCPLSNVLLQILMVMQNSSETAVKFCLWSIFYRLWFVYRSLNVIISTLPIRTHTHPHFHVLQLPKGVHCGNLGHNNVQEGEPRSHQSSTSSFVPLSPLISYYPPCVCLCPPSFDLTLRHR